MKNTSQAFKMGLRVGVAVALAEIISIFTGLKFCYWATMTVYLVMCPNMGCDYTKRF